jgi:hypothetical protein
MTFTVPFDTAPFVKEQRHGGHNRRNKRAAYLVKEKQHHEKDQNHGFNKCLNYLQYRQFYKLWDP